MNKYIFLVVIPWIKKKQIKDQGSDDIRKCKWAHSVSLQIENWVARSAFAITKPNAYFKRFLRENINNAFKDAKMAPIKTDDGVK